MIKVNLGNQYDIFREWYDDVRNDHLKDKFQLHTIFDNFMFMDNVSIEQTCKDLNLMIKEKKND